MKIGVPNRQFTLFPQFPTELRLQIWRLCRTSDRVVTLRSASFIFDEPVSYVFAEYTAPTVFHINKESRLESMKTYRPLLGTLLRNRPFPFNFSRDILRIVDDGRPQILELLFVPPNISQLEGSRQTVPWLSTKAQRELNEMLEGVLHLDLVPWDRYGPFSQGGNYRPLSDLKALRTFSTRTLKTSSGSWLETFEFIRRALEKGFGVEWKQVDVSDADPTAGEGSVTEYCIVFGRVENTEAESNAVDV